jgi:DNA-binding transcriptional ArsR family regulator
LRDSADPADGAAARTGPALDVSARLGILWVVAAAEPPEKEETMKWDDMEETLYRASQLCRVLGNPKAYQILVELRRHGPCTPSELAARIHRRMATVCKTLKTLREVHLVRYQRSGVNAVYKVKFDAVGVVMDRIEWLVTIIRKQM